MWPNQQFPTDLVIFTEKFLNGKLHFLCSDVKWDCPQRLQLGHVIVSIGMSSGL